MVLVDTSVWVDYFNGQRTSTTDALDDLLSSTLVLVGDLILTEVLHGFRHDSDFRTAKQLLLELEVRTLCDTEIALKAASNFRALRKTGITVRKTVDAVIATYCIEHALPLLFSDRDFVPFTEHLGLRDASEFPL